MFKNNDYKQNGSRLKKNQNFTTNFWLWIDVNKNCLSELKKERSLPRKISFHSKIIDIFINI